MNGLQKECMDNLLEMEDKDKNNTWRWIRKSDLKGCNEALIYSASG